MILLWCKTPTCRHGRYFVALNHGATLLRNTSLPIPQHKARTTQGLPCDSGAKRRTLCSDSEPQPVWQLARSTVTHCFPAGVTLLCSGCCLHCLGSKSKNENAQGAPKGTFPGPWGTHSWSKKNLSLVNGMRIWEEKIQFAYLVLTISDCTTLSEASCLVSLHNSFSVVSKVNCLLCVCVNIFNYWPYIHATCRTYTYHFKWCTYTHATGRTHTLYQFKSWAQPSVGEN